MYLLNRCGYRFNKNDSHLKVKEHSNAKCHFKMFGNIHLITNYKEIKDTHHFRHFSLSRKRDIDFGNQGVMHMN